MSWIMPWEVPGKHGIRPHFLGILFILSSYIVMPEKMLGVALGICIELQLQSLFWLPGLGT